MFGVIGRADAIKRPSARDGDVIEARSIRRVRPNVRDETRRKLKRSKEPLNLRARAQGRGVNIKLSDVLLLYSDPLPGPPPSPPPSPPPPLTSSF